MSGTAVRGLLSKILVLNDTLEKMNFSVVLLELLLLLLLLLLYYWQINLRQSFHFVM